MCERIWKGFHLDLNIPGVSIGENFMLYESYQYMELKWVNGEGSVMLKGCFLKVWKSLNITL